ncbi:CAP domain-containing protein [Crassaminicella profunda]|uniref:CAP domain-containing protein n=1 Tax=Crassaminicella profunda TaxID=1286698 RepID=UPI001CA7AAC1|nr:CAP domain-containing protein [Crassaminicella profunda]QZY56066.1 serine protease [Crassaminicella profunda]
MKKILSILTLCVLLFSGCTAPQQKPTPLPENEMYQNEMPENNKPMTSSIFEKGDVEKIQITKDNTSCRSGQSANSPEIQKLPKGNVYDVVGQLGDQYVVQTEDGKVGCVNPSDCKPQVEGPKTTTPSDQPNQTAQDKQEENTSRLTADEQEMLKLLNGERTKNGLKPLTIDISIVNVARLKSQDMIDNNYFSHNSPTYGSPFDMLKQFGIKYLTAGENIAGNPSVQNAHTSLMNSEGHRKNILNPDFTHIGIGIKDGGKYGKMYTQMFVGR